MTREQLAATLNLAYGVSSVDGFADEEFNVLVKELKSYGLQGADFDAVFERYKQMPVLTALNIIADADEAVKKEAQALIVFALCADCEASEKEKGAHIFVKRICGLPDVEYDEAKRILGF